MGIFSTFILYRKPEKHHKIATPIILYLALVSITPSVTWANDSHEHENTEKHAAHNEENESNEDSHDSHESEGKPSHKEENISRIEEKMAEKVGIVTASATPQELHKTITVFGSIVSAPENLSHVRARFEGVVKTVKVSLGDTVKIGDPLAEIESNESLKTYTVRSPISGRVVQRHANTGEVTKDQVLFSVANFDNVWAELRVYPAQQDSITEGQSVHIVEGNESTESSVDHIIPSMDSPYQLARVKLNNSKKALPPGLMTEARIEVGRFQVSLAVEKDAVQTLGGRQGVFVKIGDEYRFTPLVLGKSDDHFYEVIEGLDSGSDYVSKNSYLIKADIEKSEAEHEH